MGIGAFKVFTISMASGATTSTQAVDTGRIYDHIALVVPTMTSGTDIYVRASADGVTYNRAYMLDDPVSGGDATPFTMKIGSAITQAYIGMSVRAQYFKIELSTAMTATPATFKFVCSGDY